MEVASVKGTENLHHTHTAFSSQAWGTLPRCVADMQMSTSRIQPVVCGRNVHASGAARQQNWPSTLDSPARRATATDAEGVKVHKQHTNYGAGDRAWPAHSIPGRCLPSKYDGQAKAYGWALVRAHAHAHANQHADDCNALLV